MATTQAAFGGAFDTAAEPIRLFPDQALGIEAIHLHQAEGVRASMVCAPTGWGKTVFASELLRAERDAGGRGMFIADQIDLVDQARRSFGRYGLRTGKTQGQHYGNEAQLVVASAQTLRIEGRRPFRAPTLAIIDEAHVQHREVMDWLKRTGANIVGLSATPLSEGLADYYEKVLNVVTTNDLLEQGRLVPMVAYSEPTQIDHGGVRRYRNGAYDRSELARRSAKVTGDVVSQWVERKNALFGPGARVPTVVFTNTVEDGAAYAAEFQRAGYDFRQTTYKSTDRAMRPEILQMFEEQRIDGLVSCLALAKGWDSSVVCCIIDIQTNGSSVIAPIQKYGRGMRVHGDITPDGEVIHRPVNETIERKDRFLLQDHVGNVTGWSEELERFYAVGVDQLSDVNATYGGQRRTSPARSRDLACWGCGYVMATAMTACPMCGRERRRTPTRAAANPGELELINPSEHAGTRRMSRRKRIQAEYQGRERELWYQVCAYTGDRAERELGAKRPKKWARDGRGRGWYARQQFASLMGREPPAGFSYRPFERECSGQVADAVKAQLQARAIRQRYRNGR